MGDVISNFESAVKMYDQAYGLGFRQSVIDERRRALDEARSQLIGALSQEARSQLVLDMFGISSASSAKPAAVTNPGMNKDQTP